MECCHTVRSACESDGNALASLLGQLGYDVPAQEAVLRVELTRRSGGEVLVAVDDAGCVVGCVQAIRELRLAEGSFAELVSLVVDQGCRKQGLGSLLVKAVEQWCCENGLSSLRIRCNNKRLDSQRFYTNVGFEKKKEQAIFEKAFPS